MSNYSSTIGRIAKPFNPMLVRISRNSWRSCSYVHLLGLGHCRARLSNTYASIKSIGMCRSKLATTRQFRLAGLNRRIGVTTERYVLCTSSELSGITLSAFRSMLKTSSWANRSRFVQPELHMQIYSFPRREHPTTQKPRALSCLGKSSSIIVGRR